MRILVNEHVTLHVIDLQNNMKALFWKIFRQNFILKSNLIRIKSLLYVPNSTKNLTQGLIPLLVQLLENLLKDKEPENFKLARDSFQMLAYGHMDLSNLRRQRLKMSVAEKYRPLCNDSTALTENLLGDDRKTDKNIKWDEESWQGSDLKTREKEVQAGISKSK